MSKLGTVSFSGTSGERYAFAAYPLETVFKKGFTGVYVLTQRKEDKSGIGFMHRRICMGQGDGLRHRPAGDDASFSESGANCICLHTERDKNARQRIEQDLIRKPRPSSNA
jgi:hypothetical protein